MIEVVVLYVSLYLLLIVAWGVFERDVLSPSLLVCASFIIGVTFYLLGEKRMTAPELKFSTVMLILGGVITFMVFEKLSRGLVRSVFHFPGSLKYKGLKNIDGLIKFNEYKYLFWIMLTMVIVAIVQLQHMTEYVGSGNFTTIFSTYRTDSLNDNVLASGFVNLVSRIVYGVIPVYLFMLFYKRVVCKIKFKHPIVLGISGIVYMGLLFIVSGARGRLFIFIFQLLASITICLNFSEDNNSYKVTPKKGNKFWIRTVLVIAIIGIPLFYYGGVVGGKKYSEITAFQSVCNYFSYGFIRFNIIVRDGFAESTHFGQWSFSGVYSLLNKVGGNYGDYDFFPFYGMYGNTATIFGRWYVDFGTIGVFTMSAITSILYSSIYYVLKFTTNPKRAVIYSVIYVFLISNIIMASYDDWVRNITAINTMFQLFVLIIVTSMVYKKYIGRMMVSR